MTDPNVYMEEQVNSSTTALLNRARQGEEKAWHRLLDVYLPLVYRWCRAQGLQDADVLDVGQEVLRRLSQNLARFRRERPGDNFRGWLRQITKNAVSDHYRQKQKQPIGLGGSSAQARLATAPAPNIEDSATAEGETELQILYGRLVALVRAEFSEQDWQAFHQVVVENRTPVEVAQTLRISRNQVYLAKSRILRRLREEFGPAQEERLLE